MTKILGLVSIVTCSLVIRSGHAFERNRIFAAVNDEISTNNGRKIDSFPGKLQPSWSCILLGDAGCNGTCSLMGALYGCDTNSYCRKGIYCECGEVYHFEKRDIPAKNFQNLPLNELWYYRFRKTPDSTALLNQIRNDKAMREYVTSLLRDPHMTGGDVKYLLADEYPKLNQQLQDLEVNPHGLKSELDINGDLEYENMGDYFGDLFQTIKDKVGERLEYCRSKHRILNLIKSIDNEEDIQYVLRQILLSGDDRLYNFVSNYLRRNGFGVEENSIYQPCRRFGRRRGCRKRRRFGGCRGGGNMSGNMCLPNGRWHGRPLRKKIILTHNNTPIALDADEDEVIEIAFLNELKKETVEEDKAAATLGKKPKPGVAKKQEQEFVFPPMPQITPINQEMPVSAPAKNNLFMGEIMQPSLINTTPQVPLDQNEGEIIVIPSPEMKPVNQNSYIKAPPQSNILLQETAYPIAMTSTPQVLSTQGPIIQQLEQEILKQPILLKESPISPPSQSNINMQEWIPPVLTSNIIGDGISIPALQMKPVPLELPISVPMYNEASIATNNMQQTPMGYTLEKEIQSVPSYIKPTKMEAPPSLYLSQGNTSVQETISPTPLLNTMSNNLNRFPLFNGMDSLDTFSNHQLAGQVESTIQNIDHHLPNTETNQMYSFMTPIKERVENTIPNSPIPSTTTFYADQVQERLPVSFSNTSSPPTPQLIYEYVTSTPDMISSSSDLENTSTGNMASYLASQYHKALENFPSQPLSSLSNQIGLPEGNYNFQSSNLPGSFITTNMEGFSLPSSTMSTMTSDLKNMVPELGPVISQASNMVTQNISPNIITNGRLTQVQEIPLSIKESNMLPNYPNIEISSTHEDIPRLIQQSATTDLSQGNLVGQIDYESSINKIQNTPQTNFISSQNVTGEMGEMVNNMAVGNSQLLQKNQNAESNRISMQQGMPQTSGDAGKKKKSLFYLLIDDSGNVVHSAGVDHEPEIENHENAEPSSNYSYFPGFFSQMAQNGMNPLPNYKWPYVQ